ncbi:GNAT family N-acetyltransferase [Salinisphaera sp. Q1T1-3]|uniref:GNAT family N-acetyltransferase n=1 Tax=Salinisphaera sp. Q1T1-3 TaxID=2321229 RepID=UPI000E724CC4|nr:GNAT family N-acetyltransferase [Salinisphaera sp. Q1T1-3]RJS92366.1 N-acetyltransferase [Salinisphaera sp. Q1T1-3]
MITMPATLRTARLHLRAPCAEDAPGVLAYVGDARAMRYMVWPMAETIEDVYNLLDDMAWGWHDGDDFAYAITATHEQALVGMISCQFSDDGAELGFILHPDHWGRGLAREAGAAVMAAACEIDDLYRIWACCDVDNTASMRVLEHLGMQREGVLRRRSKRPNLSAADEPRDDAVFAWVR